MSPDLAAERAAWADLLDRASEPYRGAGRFAWHFARGKLGRDPVFRHLLSAGLIPRGARVLDIGCGQGLLASLLRACAVSETAGQWPRRWPAAPVGAQVTGIELMPRDIERARAALGEDVDDARFVHGDMRTQTFPPCDTAVILDVLHYVTHEEQDAVLQRVRDALAPGGGLLLRVGDAANQRRFAVSQWVDRTVTRLRGHTAPPMHGRTLAEWIARLRQLGMAVEPHPMSQGTPFANVLLVARRDRGDRG
jgi:SAM-dependent methyltransferase